MSEAELETHEELAELSNRIASNTCPAVRKRTAKSLLRRAAKRCKRWWRRTTKRILLLIAVLFAIYFVIKYREMSLNVIAGLTRAWRRDVFDRRNFYANGLPLSDPKSVTFARFGGRAVLLVSKRVVVPPRTGWLKVTALVYVLSLGLLKRIGEIDCVERICGKILAEVNAKELRAVAYSSLADLSALRLRWCRAIADERDVMLLGTTMTYLPRQAASLSLDRLERSTADEVRQLLRLASEMCESWSMPQYQLALLLLDCGSEDAALEALAECSEKNPAELFYKHDFLALSTLLSEQERIEFPEAFLPRTRIDDKVRAYDVQQVDLISARNVRDTLADSTVMSWPGFGVEVAYQVFYSEGQRRSVQKSLRAEEVHVIAPDSVRIQAGAWPSAIVNGRYGLRSLSAYPGAQFGVFEESLVLLGNQKALKCLHPEPRNLEGDALLLWGFADNYFHFIFDCLGSLAFFPYHGNQTSKLIVSGSSPAVYPYQEALASLIDSSIPDRLIKLSSSGPDLELNNCQLCTNSNLWNTPHPTAVTFLRQRMYRANTSHGARLRLFVARSHRRRIGYKQYGALIAFLEQHEFVFVDPGRMSVKEQQELFSRAEVVVFEAGAAVANLLFCPADCRAVLLTSEFGYRDMFAVIANTIGIELTVVLSPNTSIYPRSFLCWSEVWLGLDVDSAIAAIGQVLDHRR